MDSAQARKFFLKPESYFNVPLPEYFDIKGIIDKAKQTLGRKNLSSVKYSAKEKKKKPSEEISLLSDTLDVNVRIMANKDGQYSWRPFTMIHPIIYVDLVNEITKKGNWKQIKNTFKEFQKDDRVICTSIPVESTGASSDSKEQVLSWWENMEQAQIKYALDYNYCIHTDITDCYPSIYTHTIPWAIFGKEYAKANRKGGLGNDIDEKIRNMQGGQTNGIPQGSVLMDFIAEIVLGYADTQLLELAERENLTDFRILRYRDDYRIFANSKDVAERLMKLLTEVLLDLNLKINSKKTFLCKDIILDAIKPDKIYWNIRYPSFYDYKSKNIKYKINLQKHLLEIKILGDKFQNCGQLVKALSEVYANRIKPLNPKNDSILDVEQLISITTSIMMKNPRTIQWCVAIIHKLLEFIDDDKTEDVINLILNKFEGLPNTDLVEIWIQNISVRTNREREYKNLLCRKVAGISERLWNSDWLKPEERLDESVFINEDELSKLRPKYVFDAFYSDYDV